MMDKRTLGTVLLLILLVLGIYLNMPYSNVPDFDISIQVNLKVTSQNDQEI